MKLSGRLWLASRSPRRKLLLLEAGIRPDVQPADIDDAALNPGAVPPQHWVAALAYLKARRVADTLGGEAAEGYILGADTVCVVDQQILGQPRDAVDARRMLRLMRDRSHCTITGVCVLRRNEEPTATRAPTGTEAWDRRPWRMMFVDAARVHVGSISEGQIDEYVSSEQWRGKAGAYNLTERIDDGWPITTEGDPATVMGLPMQRLVGMLQPSDAEVPREPVLDR